MSRITEIRRTELPLIDDGKRCKLIKTGEHARIVTNPSVGYAPVVQTINKDWCVDNRTGEAIERKHSEKRTDNLRSMRKTHQKLIDLFNTNFTFDTLFRVWMVTYTYRENQSDGKQAWDDWATYIKKFKRKLCREGLESPEYIAVIEPQGRGAWHFHVYFLWPSSPPKIDYTAYFFKLWGRGYVKVCNRIKCPNGANLGAYFGCYFSDIFVDDLPPGTAYDEKKVKTVQVDGQNKKMIKQGRLALYPAGMRYYQCSRGIKRPTERVMSYGAAKEKMASAGASCSYHSSLEFVVDGSEDFLVTLEYFDYPQGRRP